MVNRFYVIFCCSPLHPAVLILESGRIQYNCYYACLAALGLENSFTEQWRGDRE